MNHVTRKKATMYFLTVVMLLSVFFHQLTVLGQRHQQSQNLDNCLTSGRWS
ncbi:hypothetical protein G4V62_18265 [Bacillaceae bacterium SIJ1]|uniref:hypothetical protein n=1 Tax=Litoribacterium kuwaitense TaxID=1398745 RepID=UPI0013EB06CF|nr:hypothetical protein [Litoribacterium kuwaitense]NGP46790.1 hypothetical protein [Litoribacterium kuwaitense]